MEGATCPCDLWVACSSQQC